MALRLVQVAIKAGALLQDLRDNRCHHHSGAQTTVDLPNNRVTGLMVRRSIAKVTVCQHH